MKRELVIVMDFGGQYNQLVARRVRECNVIVKSILIKSPLEKIKEMNPKGIILTCGPNSCYLEDSPTYSKELFELGYSCIRFMLWCSINATCFRWKS